jgi:hypothetical protein
MLHVNVNLHQGAEPARAARKTILDLAAALGGDRRLYCEQLGRLVGESLDATDVDALAQEFVDYLDAAATLAYFMGGTLAVGDHPEEERADLLDVFAAVERGIAELPMVPLHADDEGRID